MSRDGLPQPASLHALITDYLETQRAVIVRGDVASIGSPEPVHKARVAIRRYRSVLRVFASELLEEETTLLDGELRWYAVTLGAVRDVHVLGAHLDTALDELVDFDLDGARAAITRRLRREESMARAELAVVLASPRFASLLATLDRWRETPPFSSPDQALKEVVQFVDAAERRAARQLRRSSRAEDQNEALHRARKAGKRARYAAEVSRPVLGAAAVRRIAAAKSMQNTLGVVQDSSVALEFLEAVAADPATDGSAGFVLGVLWMNEQRRQASALHDVE